MSHKDQSNFGEDLSKLDIAEIQTNSAIHMLFNNMHPVAVHTIAASGYQIIRDLACKAKTEEYLMFMDHIKQGRQGAFWSHTNKAWRFFKHAERDSDATFDGADELINDFTIFMEVRLYRSLGRKSSLEMNSFAAWFTCSRPELLMECPLRDSIEKNYQDCNADQFSREELLNMGKKTLAQTISGPLE